jgi:CHAD domain-containing protein
MSLDAKRIHKPIRKLRKFFKKAPRRPTIDEVHDLRTNSRRFETEIDAFGLSSKRNERRLLRHLRKIRKRAGKIRDLDVLTGYLLGLNVDGEQGCIVELVESFGMDRGRHVKKLRKLVLETRTQLRPGLKRSASKLQKLVTESQENPGGSDPPRVAEAAAKALRLADELKSPARLNEGNLHPYRLKVKALQYVLQLSSEADQQEFVDALREVKDAIGEWHDWGELIAIASDTLDHGEDCKLLPKLKEIRDEKYERALSLANEMRERFIGLNKGRHLRRGTKSISRRPVMEAASAITSR